MVGKISCLVIPRIEGIRHTVRCPWVCSVGPRGKEGKREKLEPVCTCTEVTAGLLTVCQCRGQSLPEEGLGYRQTSEPASQTGSQPHRLQSRSGARAWTRAAQVTQTDLLTLFGSARLSSQASEPNAAEVT